MSRKFRNNFIQMVLAVALLGGITAGCTGCSTENDNSKPVEISILYSDIASAPFNENWEAIQYIEKTQNVKLKVQSVPGSDFAAKRSVILSSGTIPDLVSSTWANQVNQYAIDGILLPVSDYMDKFPNLRKILDSWNMPGLVKDISEKDGKFYIMPSLVKEPYSASGFMIRKDIMEKHGLQKPETYEELLALTVKLKELYPNSLGIGDEDKGKVLMSFVASAFDTKGGYSLPYGYTYDSSKKEWYFAPTSDRYKELLTYLNRMYQAGVLDPEAFTQNITQFKQKIINEQYLIAPAGGRTTAENYTKYLQDAGVSGEFEMLYPLAGPTGIRRGKPVSYQNGGTIIPAKLKDSKKFDRVLSFADWLYYSEESALVSTIGLEGVTYDRTDGEIILKPEIYTPNTPTGTKNIKTDFGFGLPGLSSAAEGLVDDSILSLVKGEAFVKDKRYIVDQGMVEMDDPAVGFSQEQMQEVKLLTTNLNDYTGTMIVKFIFGEEPFDRWDEYVEKCRSLGADHLIEIVRSAAKQ